jgi:hypothetical protein
MLLLAGLRQWQYCKEFRITPSVWPSKLLAEFEKLSQALESKASEGLNRTAANSNIKIQQQFLADVGTGLWRLRQKMVQSGTNQPLDEMRRAYRHLESTWDTFTQAGIEIQDHTGESFNSGMSLKAIAFQPMSGIRREEVMETIKPSIYLNNQLIQMGEVIVATPEKSSGDIK